VKPGRQRFWKRVRRRLREPLVLAGLAAGSALVPRLSRRAVIRLSGCLGALVRAADITGRRVARANLGVLFGPRLSPRRRRLLVAGAYRQAALVALDGFWFGRDTRARVGRWLTIAPALREAVAAARPALVVTAHYGNWEMTMLVGGYMGVPLVGVVKPQWSAKVTERLNRLRCALGVRVVFAEGALRVLLRELRAGSVAGLLIDQHTPEEQGGVWVDFGGLPAAVSKGVAVLARHTGAPVYLAFCRARRDGRFLVSGSEALRPRPDEDDAAFTQRIANGIVRAIRRHPSQWMVMYKRWEAIAPGADPGRYPFYARPSP
jgi:KDO2-lipid IV(A) lauroyltransferase